VGFHSGYDSCSDSVDDVTHDVAWPEARQRASDAGERRARDRVAIDTSLTLTEARDLVLAADVTSMVDLPSFDTSAMDGWAVSGIGPWRVVGEIRAGEAQKQLAAGEALTISTGAMVPPGAAVLRSERGVHDGERLHVAPDADALAPGTDVRKAGEEVRHGEVILRAGQVLTPPALGLAAAAGHDRLGVVPCPTVSVLILGDELIDDGVPQDGQVRDALAPQLPGWIRSIHGDLSVITRVVDRLDLTVDAIATAASDVIITTGGTSSGPADHVRAAVESLGGTWLVDGVAVRPGHPMKLAALGDDRFLVALPGNPLAAVSGLLTLGEPLLAALAGRSHERDHATARTIRRALAEPVETSPSAHRLIPAQIADGRVHPAVRRGPAMLSGLAVADVVVVVPPGREPLQVGSDVNVLPLPWGTGLVV
jgi:molybdopterin molybdotransferase